MSQPLSTVVMSVYNVTALMGPCTKLELMNTFEAQNFECTEAQLDEAIAAGIERGWLAQTDPARVCSVGPRGWVAWLRDNDAEGWSNWVCRNLKTGERKPLAELIQGVTANA